METENTQTQDWTREPKTDSDSGLDSGTRLDWDWTGQDRNRTGLDSGRNGTGARQDSGLDSDRTRAWNWTRTLKHRNGTLTEKHNTGLDSKHYMELDLRHHTGRDSDTTLDRTQMDTQTLNG